MTSLRFLTTKMSSLPKFAICISVPIIKSIVFMFERCWHGNNKSVIYDCYQRYSISIIIYNILVLAQDLARKWSNSRKMFYIFWNIRVIFNKIKKQSGINFLWYSLTVTNFSKKVLQSKINLNIFSDSIIQFYYFFILLK